MEVRQYEIVLVNLDPTIGSEIRKTRPCVVISPDEMNKYLQTIIIAPLICTLRPYPTRVKIRQAKVKGWVALDQIRTIDRARLVKKVGMLTSSEIEFVKAVIMETYVE